MRWNDLNGRSIKTLLILALIVANIAVALSRRAANASVRGRRPGLISLAGAHLGRSDFPIISQAIIDQCSRKFATRSVFSSRIRFSPLSGF